MLFAVDPPRLFPQYGVMTRGGLVLLAVLLSGAPAFAQVTGKGLSAIVVPSDPQEARTKRLDTLYARLKEAPSAELASAIEEQIGQVLSQTGSDTADLLMLRAAAAQTMKQNDLALGLVDGLLELQPAYAEGRYRRASLLFARDDYGGTLAELQEVLRLEPRHLPALMALALVLDTLDRKKSALLALRRVRELSPFHEGLDERIRMLTLEVEGRGI